VENTAAVMAATRELHTADKTAGITDAAAVVAAAMVPAVMAHL